VVLKKATPGGSAKPLFIEPSLAGTFRPDLGFFTLFVNALYWSIGLARSLVVPFWLGMAALEDTFLGSTFTLFDKERDAIPWIPARR
jgi:hypothetical protein